MDTENTHERIIDMDKKSLSVPQRNVKLTKVYDQGIFFIEAFLCTLFYFLYLFKCNIKKSHIKIHPWSLNNPRFSILHKTTTWLKRLLLMIVGRFVWTAFFFFSQDSLHSTIGLRWCSPSYVRWHGPNIPTPVHLSFICLHYTAPFNFLHCLWPWMYS